MVYIDYLNLMKNWRNPNSENTYLKVKQLAEDVKAVAIEVLRHRIVRNYYAEAEGISTDSIIKELLDK